MHARPVTALRIAFLLVAGALLASLPAQGQQAPETRLALVISQTSYTGNLSRVALAEQEAELVASSLVSARFAVKRARDLTQAQMRIVLDNFRREVEQAGANAVAFVYYTGHGLQHPQTGDSYLLGVDARLQGMSDLARYGIGMQSQRDGFAATGAKAVFLVFDACRNVPSIPGFKANVKGLSRVEASADMLIAFSTSPNSVAEEGVYAPVLAEELLRPVSDPWLSCSINAMACRSTSGPHVDPQSVARERAVVRAGVTELPDNRKVQPKPKIGQLSPSPEGGLIPGRERVASY